MVTFHEYLAYATAGSFPALIVLLVLLLYLVLHYKGLLPVAALHRQHADLACYSAGLQHVTSAGCMCRSQVK